MIALPRLERADPMPRTAQRIVNDCIRSDNARTKGPYVLVGHSFGGTRGALYAAQYPEEVVGMVLVDPTHPSQWLQMTEEQRKRLETGARLSRRGEILARLGIARLTAFLVSAGALGIARSQFPGEWWCPKPSSGAHPRPGEEAAIRALANTKGDLGAAEVF